MYHRLVILEQSCYGTTTCAIAVQQNNSGALIAVEPDPSVWAIQEVGVNWANFYLLTNLNQ